MIRHRVGHPDNPLSRTRKLFPDNYLIHLNGGIFSIKKKIPGLDLVELHFQTFEEMPKKIDLLKAYVSKLRSMDIDFVAHMPFMRDKNKPLLPHKALNFDFVWPLIPAKCVGKPVVHLPEVDIFVQRAEMIQYQKFIRLVSALHIRVLTMHVSKSAILLNDSEWNAFLKWFKVLNKYARQRKVILAVETGGLLENHLQDIVNVGGKLNFDSAHYFLDMMALGKNEKEANTMTLKAYEKFCEHVPVIHLTQTVAGKDAHMSLLDTNGALTCNDEIVRIAKRYRTSPFIILETHPDGAAVVHVKKILATR